MTKMVACPNSHPVLVPVSPGFAVISGLGVETRSAEDEFLDCTLCGPFRQDSKGNAKSIIDQVADSSFRRELVDANRAVLATLMIEGETAVDLIAVRIGLDHGMLRAVLANADVFEVETGMNEPTVLVSAKLTPYGHRLATIARNEKTQP